MEGRQSEAHKTTLRLVEDLDLETWVRMKGRDALGSVAPGAVGHSPVVGHPQNKSHPCSLAFLRQSG